MKITRRTAGNREADESESVESSMFPEIVYEGTATFPRSRIGDGRHRIATTGDCSLPRPLRRAYDVDQVVANGNYDSAVRRVLPLQSDSSNDRDVAGGWSN